MIPDEKVKEVSERSPILEVISDYVHLRRSGANYQGLCPFHGEKTPSFNVNPARGIFHCFGCGVGGNAFSFIMRMEGLTFPDAVKFLARRAGVTIDERPLSAAEKKRQDERDACYHINELTAQFYRQVLLKDASGEPGRRYLAQRGVDETTAEAYRLGYAPDRWDGLVRFLERKQVPLDQAEKLGSIRRKSDKSGYVDLFRNRLIFTINDPQGRPIGFGGRVLDDALPKYINSPESAIYRKSEVLFGVNLAKQAMREKNAAIIVEGYFDHLALYQAGIRNVAATCGTAMTDGHLKLMQRYAGKIYTLFDADSAGKKATFRAMDLMLGIMPVSVIEMPPGEDPDSLLRKQGSDAFSERVNKARSILDFYLRDLMLQIDTGTVEGKVKVIEELAPRLEKITNQVERELYLREIARMLGVDERILHKKMGRKTLSTADFARPREKRSAGTGTEDMLLALMGRYPEVADKVESYGIDKLFQPDLAPIAKAVVDCLHAGQEVDWSMILEQTGSTEERSRLAALLVNDEQLEGVNALKMFDELRISRERRGLREIDRLKKELVREEPGSERYGVLLKEIDALRNMKSQLI